METRSTLPQPSQPPSSLVEIEGAEPRFNLVGALLGGLFGALAGAAMWAVIVAVTGWQSGIVAVLVGMLVGAAVRFAGRGVNLLHGIIAALFALFGTVAGNVLAVASRVSEIRNVSLLDMLSPGEFPFVVRAYTGNFETIDLLFYGFAIYSAFSAAGRTRRQAASPQHAP